MRTFLKAVLVPLLVLLPVVPAFAGGSSDLAAGTTSAARAARGLPVDTDSWGPLEIGMSAREARRTGMVSKRESACIPGYEMTRPYGDRGTALWGGQFPRMWIRGLWVWSPDDRTRSGAGVGSTLRQVRRLVPTVSEVFSEADLRGFPRIRRDRWGVSVRRGGTTLTFQFAFGQRPRPSSRVEYLVVARKRLLWGGC